METDKHQNNPLIKTMIPNQICLNSSTSWQLDADDVDSLVSFSTNAGEDESDSDESSSFTSSVSSDSRWNTEDNIVSDSSSPRVPLRRKSLVAANCAKLVGDLPRIPRRRVSLIFNTTSTGSCEGVNETDLPNNASESRVPLDLPPMLPARLQTRKPAAPSAVLRLSPQRIKKMKPPTRPNRKSSAEVESALLSMRAAATSFSDISLQFPNRKCHCPPSVRARGAQINRQHPQQKSATAA